MSQANLQFSVATHIMAALGANADRPVRSAELAGSVNTDPSFVRRVVSKLSKAGLVTTQRGKNGACSLARPAEAITLLDIFQASETPEVCSVHGYAVTKTCQVSRNIKGCLHDVLDEAQASFEQALSRRTLAQLVADVREGR